MIAELFLAMPGTGEIFLGGIMNGQLLNVPDVIKIGLMAFIAVVLVKWALNTMGQKTIANYI